MTGPDHPRPPRPSRLPSPAVRGRLGRLAVTAAAVAVAALLTAQTRPSTPHTAGAIDHAAFDGLLADTVRGELVDYRRVKSQHASVLRTYLERMAAVDVKSLARDEQLAYYINLYNASMIQAVLDRMKPGWSPAADEFSVFDAKLVRLAGRTVSLNALENEIIRPTFKDARIHVALVCGAKSCPPLLPRAYRASDLNAVLDANMKRFVADPSRNRIDVRNRRLQLSKILEWYAVDFGGPARVSEYVNRWTDKDVQGFAVSFLEYDWTLNGVR